MANTAKFQLNVVLHGLWGIEANRDKIRIVTTEEHHHVIKAGKRGDLKDAPDKEYTLKGVNELLPGEFPSFSEDRNPTIKEDNDVTADTGQVKTVINLPYPKEIHSVRTGNTNGVKFFKDNRPTTPAKLAAVQVLVYTDIKDYTKLTLSPHPWTPELNPRSPADPDGITVNLHVHAEPDKHMSDEIEQADEIARKAKKEEDLHFVKAGVKLAKAFGLVITPLKTMKRLEIPPEDPGVRGLTPQDTITLFEHGNSAAVSPSGCNMLVINNRKPLGSPGA